MEAAARHEELAEMTRICIIIPVYNDWTSFETLVRRLGEALPGTGAEFEIVAVDDCSPEQPPLHIPAPPPITRISTIRLVTNLGHQRAITVGLVSIADRKDIDGVAIMDSDGEDRPEDLCRLVGGFQTFPRVVLVVERAKRSEGIQFRFFYQLYMLGFRILTSHNLRFGNFSIVPFEYVEQLVARPDTWNNFIASVIRTRLPIKLIPTARGTRYAGQSKMNFVNLIIHGLGAMSVFSDVVFVRILFASVMAVVVTALCALGAVYLRIFTDLAIPGWTSTVLGFLLLIGLNSVMLAIMLAFLHLNRRSSIDLNPKDRAGLYVKHTIVLSDD